MCAGMIYMFKIIKDNFKKSEAAVMVDKLLQSQIDIGNFETKLVVKDLANTLVQQAWSLKPDLLGGRFGTRPHKLSVVIFTFSAAAAIENEDSFKKSSSLQDVCLIILSLLSNELKNNGRLYNLSQTDDVIIELAFQAAAEIIDEKNKNDNYDMKNFTTRSPDDLEYTWDEWYEIFIDSACSVEGGVTRDESGLTIVDLLDHEPLKRAHHDGICPIQHGMYFGKNFDITDVRFGD